LYARVKEELKVAELEMKAHNGEPESEIFFDEEVGADIQAEEGVIADFLSLWTSSDQPEDLMI
jgi:hypothetical protein